MHEGVVGDTGSVGSASDYESDSTSSQQQQGRKHKRLKKKSKRQHTKSNSNNDNNSSNKNNNASITNRNQGSTSEACFKEFDKLPEKVLWDQPQKGFGVSPPKMSLGL